MKTEQRDQFQKGSNIKTKSWHAEDSSRQGTSHLVHEILFPLDKSFSYLYLRVIDGYAEFDEQSITLEEGTKITSNTYFNSFYENYWSTYTTLMDASLILQFKGCLHVEIFRETKDTGCSKIEWKSVANKSVGVETIKLPLFEVGQMGRIFVDITAEEDSEIYYMGFRSNNSPERKPRLTLGISTADREEYLVRSLIKLVNYASQVQHIEKIIIANQGEEFSHPKLRELIADSDLVHYIGCDSLSGQNGFAAAVHESLNVRDANYHVLMGDDVQLDPRIISNLIAFISYLKEEIVIGSHMLDSRKPWILFEAGALAGGDARSSSMHYDIDLRGVDSLMPFSSMQDIVNNAWWFCAVPTRHMLCMKQAGAFIVAEDAAKGVVSTTLPGIAVWHESVHDWDDQEEQDVSSADNLIDTHVVQDIMLSGQKAVSDLYLRFLHGSVEERKKSLLLKKGTKISTNTYFNSFYEDYWNKYAALDDLKFVVQFRGRLFIEAFRDTKNNGCNRIEWKEVKSNGVSIKSVKLPVFEVGQMGRIFVDITAEDDSEIYYMGLRTQSAPSRKPVLTFGICTFNREDYLYRNLSKLVEYPDHGKTIAKIIVVNQGMEFAHPRLLELIEKNPLIHCIKQGNLGGCGGFTRTMYEALRIEEANYHVMMDDDVQIDPRIISNLGALISFLSKEIVVGGHMLDLLRPWVLYEAGAMVRENTRITPLHHNIDLRGVDSLIPFNSASDVDYNAWWFCAIPKKYLTVANYPAPIFIRGDDMEYGLRLQKLGVATVAMPGIAVWHEPFYVKAGGWQTYYDFRNRFILASAYPERFRLETPSFMLLIMMKALAVHDYQEAALIQMAVEDFLKGPALFDEESSVKIHERVAALNKRFQPLSVDGNKKYKGPKLRENPKKRLRRTLKIVRRLLAVLLSGRRKAEADLLFMDRDVHIGNIGVYAYVKTNGIRSFHLQYSPDRESLKYLLKGCMSAYLRYRSHSRETAKKWNEDLPRFRKTAWWGSIFGQK